MERILFALAAKDVCEVRQHIHAAIESAASFSFERSHLWFVRSGWVCVGLLVLCFVSLSLATVLPLCWCCCVALARFVEGVGSDGYQTQRRSSWVPGKERVERVLADAITIGWPERDGSASCAPRLMCGPVGVAGVASPTSRLVCKENTRRLSLRRIKGGIRLE